MALKGVDEIPGLRTAAKGDCMVKKRAHGAFTCHLSHERPPNAGSQVVRPQLNGACMLSGSQLKCLGLDHLSLDWTNSHPVLHALPNEDEEQPELVHHVSIKL